MVEEHRGYLKARVDVDADSSRENGDGKRNYTILEIRFSGRATHVTHPPTGMLSAHRACQKAELDLTPRV
jgi:hypothetical protein